MSLLEQRFADTFDEHFDPTSQSQFRLLLDPAGALTSSAAGLALSVDKKSFRGGLDPSAGTIALPVAATATVNPGTALELGDTFLVLSAGTVGATVVNPGTEVVVNTVPPTTDAHFFFQAPAQDTSGLTPQTRSLIAGAGLVGGGDLTADRTLDIGAGNGIDVAADSVSVRPDSAPAANFAPVTVGATGVSYGVAGFRTVTDNITINAGHITAGAGGTITLSNTPLVTTDTKLAVRGAPAQQYNTDFSVTGAVLTIADPLKALMVVGDLVTITYSY